MVDYFMYLSEFRLKKQSYGHSSRKNKNCQNNLNSLFVFLTLQRGLSPVIRFLLSITDLRMKATSEELSSKQQEHGPLSTTYSPDIYSYFLSSTLHHFLTTDGLPFANPFPAPLSIQVQFLCSYALVLHYKCWKDWSDPLQMAELKGPESSLACRGCEGLNMPRGMVLIHHNDGLCMFLNRNAIQNMQPISTGFPGSSKLG